MTCTETYGSGLRIVGTTTTAAHLRTAEPGRTAATAPAVYCGAGRGSTARPPCVPQTAAGTTPETGAPGTVSESRGRWIEFPDPDNARSSARPRGFAESRASLLGVPTLAGHRAVAQGTSGTLACPICADPRCFMSSVTSIKQRVMGSSMQARASSPRQARESGATSTVRGQGCPRSQEARDPGKPAGPGGGLCVIRLSLESLLPCLLCGGRPHPSRGVRGSATLHTRWLSRAEQAPLRSEWRTTC